MNENDVLTIVCIMFIDNANPHQKKIVFLLTSGHHIKQQQQQQQLIAMSNLSAPVISLGLDLPIRENIMHAIKSLNRIVHLNLSNRLESINWWIYRTIVGQSYILMRSHHRSIFDTWYFFWLISSIVKRSPIY